MELRIRECAESGTFEVLEIKPVSLANFEQKEHAQLFCDALIGEAVAAANSPVEPPAQQPETNSQIEPIAPEPEVRHPEQRPEDEAESVDEADTGLPPAVVPADVPASDEWSELELTSAFDLLDEGKPLKEVAAWHGKSWTSLRARWAAEKSRRKRTQFGETSVPTHEEPTASTALVPVQDPPKTPLEKVTTAVAELNAQDKCRVCQRHFTSTPDNLELCARCRHGA